MHIIARIHNDFPTKFGLPRQSGLAQGLQSTIVFEKEYRNMDALRGLEGYSHLWLIWEFHQAKREGWSPTVRPPRLGGNKRIGVFATRSPFRPNPLGLSCVKLEAIRQDEALGPVLLLSGADLMDDTPIFDIKPYLPYADCHPEATGGFAHEVMGHALQVHIPDQWLALIPDDKRDGLRQILSQDPRPGYQQDPSRIYGFSFAGMEIRFTVQDETLTVCRIEKATDQPLPPNNP